MLCNAPAPLAIEQYRPVCLLAIGHDGPHGFEVQWQDGPGWIVERPSRPVDVGRAADVDDAPTQKLPPIRDRILPRPPAAVRELRGSELLRALADEIDADPDTAGRDL